MSRARETGGVSRRGTVTRFGWRRRARPGGRAGEGGCAGGVRGPRPCVRVRATTFQRHVPRTQPPRFGPQRTLHAAFGGGNEPEPPSGRALPSASAARAPWARAGLRHILDVRPSASGTSGDRLSREVTAPRRLRACKRPAHRAGVASGRLAETAPLRDGHSFPKRPSPVSNSFRFMYLERCVCLH